MSSFLSRMANEATAALSDAYGHVMHGDDAGSSAKLVWVVHPTKVPLDIPLGGGGNNNADGAEGTSVNGDNGSAVGSPGRSGGGKNLPSSASSFLFTQKFDLGLTFLEINDRAYVRTVDAGSMAEKAGVQPQDCVQFACVVGGPQFEDVQQTSPDSPLRSRRNNSTSGSRGRRKAADERENEKHRLEVKATNFVLECEKRGMRIGYDELRDLFSGCTLPPKDGGGHSNNDSGNADALNTPTRSLAPTQSPKTDDDFTIGSNSLIAADSVNGMFERSKKYDSSKNATGSRRVPLLPDKKVAKNVTLNVTNAARNAAGRCFDDEDVLDDDDDDSEFQSGAGDNNRRSSKKTKKRTSLSDLANTPASPIKTDNVAIPASSRQRSLDSSGRSYSESIVEQSLYPVVMVFRRTVQRKRILSPANKGWVSPGLSLKGSLFGIPSFRMDDECDRAAALIRQLAPSKNKGGKTKTGENAKPDNSVFYPSELSDDDSISQAPTVTTSSGDRPANDEDIEASTIRSMIQHAVGLGFVRLSKVVVGVSLQGGSGIIISRLPDGTWSAPSAMGVYGLGVGLQFGLEVADFMFIIQTEEGMAHFKRGGNFAVGGNIGASVVGCGREAYGAASIGSCTGPLPLDMEEKGNDVDDDRTFDESTYQSNFSTLRNKQQNKNGNDIAPIVAYASSQGLYFGVSVDGLKFFTRNDLNHRTYKFAMLGELPAKDILSGLVTPPPEAEDLYAALYSVEFTHEISELPRPPEMLRRDSMNDWRYDRSIAASNGDIVDNNSRKSSASFPLYSFLSTLNREESDQFSLFETKFKKFLYGGVAVQHLMPHSTPTHDGLTRREKRTLWLMLPEVGALRLGFVSKAKDGKGDMSTMMDDITVASSVASSRADADDFLSPTNAEDIKLSKKYSVSLTDITSLSQDPNVTIRLSPDDATEHLRVLSIHDVRGKSMLFLANSNKEAELLFCGLKLLLEGETARLSVRGGVPLNNLGGELGKSAVSPLTARGGSLKSGSGRRPDTSKNRSTSRKAKGSLNERSNYSSLGEPGSDSDASGDDNAKDSLLNSGTGIAKLNDRHFVPEGRQSWSQMPGRNYMQQQAVIPRSQAPVYELGNAVCADIATNVSLSLPLALCRVLFLDSNSPMNKTWESGRADSDYSHGAWAFPPGSMREFDRTAAASEHQLISSGSMVGAKRTISYSRIRNRELVRLSETIVVERDDSDYLVFVVADQMPRRGFSARARVYLRSFGPKSCEARVVTEICPVGKNLSNQQAVHKAYVLVLDEMKKRYGLEENGLLAVFLDAYNTIPGNGVPPSPMRNSLTPRSQAGAAPSPSSKSQSSITSFKDVLPATEAKKSTPPRQSQHNNSSYQSPKRPTSKQLFQERPSTPSVHTITSKTVSTAHKASPQNIVPIEEFADFDDGFDDIPRNPVTVEVKPLPKIRLDLCPAPREEDEEESSDSVAELKQKKKSKSSRHSKSKHRRRNR